MFLNIVSCLQPDACQTDFDAVSMIRGELFFFKSGFVWRIRDGHLESGYPALASRHWRGIPDNVDAAFEDKSGNIWFFQGEQWGQQLLICGTWFLTSTRSWGVMCRQASLNRCKMLSTWSCRAETRSSVSLDVAIANSCSRLYPNHSYTTCCCSPTKCCHALY